MQCFCRRNCVSSVFIPDTKALFDKYLSLEDPQEFSWGREGAPASYCDHIFSIRSICTLYIYYTRLEWQITRIYQECNATYVSIIDISSSFHFKCQCQWTKWSIRRCALYCMFSCIWICWPRQHVMENFPWALEYTRSTCCVFSCHRLLSTTGVQRAALLHFTIYWFI